MFELSIDHIYSDAYLYIRNGDIIDHFSELFDNIEEPSRIVSDMYEKNKQYIDWKPRRILIPDTHCLSFNEYIPSDKQVRLEDCPHLDYHKLKKKDIEMRRVIVSLFKK